jgi:hypothetical protein
MAKDIRSGNPQSQLVLGRADWARIQANGAPVSSVSRRRISVLKRERIHLTTQFELPSTMRMCLRLHNPLQRSSP